MRITCSRCHVAAEIGRRVPDVHAREVRCPECGNRAQLWFPDSPTQELRPEDSGFRLEEG